MVELTFKLPPTKVVVRNLPPLLQEKDFRGVLDKVAQDSYDWLHFVQGKARYAAIVAQLSHCCKHANYASDLSCNLSTLIGIVRASPFICCTAPSV